MISPTIFFNLVLGDHRRASRSSRPGAASSTEGGPAYATWFYAAPPLHERLPVASRWATPRRWPGSSSSSCSVFTYVQFGSRAAGSTTRRRAEVSAAAGRRAPGLAPARRASSAAAWSLPACSRRALLRSRSSGRSRPRSSAPRSSTSTRRSCFPSRLAVRQLPARLRARSRSPSIFEHPIITVLATLGRSSRRRWSPTPSPAAASRPRTPLFMVVAQHDDAAGRGHDHPEVHPLQRARLARHALAADRAAPGSAAAPSTSS